ncbi:MAG TPA: patatin-like phospholipase family protein, partial [Acidimicrobiia bacterium]|nr:patatin-like phospholipase family protein [Acidimicrobiia bacterium]
RGGRDVAIGEIGRGEVVGDMALLSDAPRSATVTTIRDTSLLRLSRVDFLEFIAEHPAALLQMTRMLVRRLQTSHLHAATGGAVKTIAVVPAGPTVTTPGFTGSFAVAATPWGSAQVIDRPRVSLHFGEAAPDATPGSDEYAARAAWLDPFEEGDELVIYVADHGVTEWTRHCIRQADRILLLADPAGDPAPGPVEAEIRSSVAQGARVELILLHPPETVRPADTASWLKDRPAMRHHHVRADRQSDYERVARLLSGRGVGVVLSGGGARGFAHAGVIRALGEAGIPIDLIGGASFGSATAAFHAMGYTPAEIVQHSKEVTVDVGSLVDFTFPAVSLSKGRRLTAGIRHSFADLQVEDLWTGFFCVSSDLTDGRVRVHDSGPLWQAVRSSVAIPGTFPPVKGQDGHVLVDGGVMNNIPVDVMERLVEGGLIIAIDLRAGIDLPSDDLPDDGIVSGWRVMLRRLNPFKDSSRVPRMIDTLLRATESASGRHEYHADLVIRPPVKDFGILDFDDYERIVEAGYQHARDVLAGWEGRPTWLPAPPV